jgi:hypothetical protein
VQLLFHNNDEVTQLAEVRHRHDKGFLSNNAILVLDQSAGRLLPSEA